MTLENDQQFYRELQEALQTLQTQLEEASNPTLQAEILKIQRQVQRHVAANSALDEVQTQVQSIQVEMNKQLRLLETDRVFLQAARQPATIQQRKQQMGQRLALLLRYCDAILSI